MSSDRYNPFSEQTSQDDMLERVLGYPYEQHPTSYIFKKDEIISLDDGSISSELSGTSSEEDYFSSLAEITGEDVAQLRGRIFVVAAGSNSSPAQLARKFSTVGVQSPLPVLKARIENYAVVYASYISSYGAIPATLHYYTESHSDIFLTLLTRHQLRHMNLSEDVGDAYALASLRNGSISMAGTRLPSIAYGYFALSGALLDQEKRLVGLAHLGQQCHIPAVDQLGVQRI